MVVRGGGILKQQATVLARLREGPGEAARQAVMVGARGPAPSRWTLRTIRATVDWLQPYSLSGVWRVLTGLDLRLRSAQVQQYSPDPAYVRYNASKPALEHAPFALGQAEVFGEGTDVALLTFGFLNGRCARQQSPRWEPVGIA